MTSINQKSHRDSLPNFRNLGVILRILVIVNVMGFIAALLKSPTWHGVIREFTEIAVVIQPMLLMNLLLLYGLYKSLSRLSYVVGISVVLILQLVLATITYWFGGIVSNNMDIGVVARYWVLSLAITGTLLAYFNLRSRALSPAFTEARLQALQSRIRPHFLFNCINAVLSLIRTDPKRAEHALEDMADLFRVLMADNRPIITVAKGSRIMSPVLTIGTITSGESVLRSNGI